MKNALVSFIMPVYKSRPSYLEKSLNSVFSQTYDDIEVIISMDLSIKALDELIFNIFDEFKDDHRLRVLVRSSSRGFCRALNEGILISHGTYIARLDSDDLSEPNRLQLQLDYVRTLQANLTGSWAYVLDEEDKIVGELKTPVSEKLIRKLIMLHNPFIHSSIVFEKKIVKEIGLYHELYEGAEDYEFYLRLMSHGYKCTNVPAFLVSIRENSNSITRGNKWKRTRINYSKTKIAAVARYHYHNWYDIFSAFISPSAIFMTPKMATRFKKILNLSANILMKKYSWACNLQRLNKMNKR